MDRAQETDARHERSFPIVAGFNPISEWEPMLDTDPLRCQHRLTYISSDHLNRWTLQCQVLEAVEIV